MGRSALVRQVIRGPPESKPPHRTHQPGRASSVAGNVLNRIAQWPMHLEQAHRWFRPGPRQAPEEEMLFLVNPEEFNIAIRQPSHPSRHRILRVSMLWCGIGSGDY